MADLNDVNDVIVRLKGQRAKHKRNAHWWRGDAYGCGSARADHHEALGKQLTPIIRDLEALRDEQQNDLPDT